MANFNFISYGTATASTSFLGTMAATAVTAGNLLIFSAYYGTSTVTAISDNLSGVWNIFYNANSYFFAYSIVPVTGTSTITYTGNESPVGGHAQVAQYTVAPSYVINPYVTTLEGPLIGTATTVVNVYGALNSKSLNTATEGIIISIASDTNTGTVYTQSAGTMRGTQGGAAAITMSLGDYDFTGTPGNIFGTLTATQTTAGTRIYCFFNMAGFTPSAGGFLESGWDGGMRG